MDDVPGSTAADPPPTDQIGRDGGPAPRPPGDTAEDEEAPPSASSPREPKEGRPGDDHDREDDGRTGGESNARPGIPDPEGGGPDGAGDRYDATNAANAFGRLRSEDPKMGGDPPAREHSARGLDDGEDVDTIRPSDGRSSPRESARGDGDGGEIEIEIESPIPQLVVRDWSDRRDPAIAIDGDDGDGVSSGKVGGSLDGGFGESKSDDDDVVEITGTKPAPASAAQSASQFRSSGGGFEPVARPGGRRSFPGVGRGSYGGGGGGGPALASEISAIATAASAGFGRANGGVPPPSSRASFGGGMPSSSSLYAPSYAPNYSTQPAATDLPMPPGHDATWRHLLPRDHDLRASAMTAFGYGGGYGGYGMGMGGGPVRRKVGLTLINPWEFTLTVEGLDMYGRTTAGDEVSPLVWIRCVLSSVLRLTVSKHFSRADLFTLQMGMTLVVGALQQMHISISMFEMASILQFNARWGSSRGMSNV